MPSLMDKMMMNVNSCFCGCSLRAGTFILMWVIMLFGFVFLLICFFSPEKIPILNPKEPILQYYLYQYLILMVIVSALALYGIFNRMSLLLLTHVYVNLIEMALLWMAWVLYLCFPVEIVSSDTIIAGTLQRIIHFGSSWYFMSVVYRHYMELESYRMYVHQSSNRSELPNAQLEIRGLTSGCIV